MSGSAGIVLAGGRSSRMGTPKAALEWHGSTLLRRTVGILARVTGGPVIVVRAPGQPLPDLPPGTEVVDDPQEGLGPVQGLAAGLAAAAGRAGVAFVCSTDLPFLHPAFVRRVLRAAQEGADVGLPHAGGYLQPLAASYRTALAPVAGRLVRERRLRPAFLFDACAVTRLDEAALRSDPILAALDPELDSVLNVNEPGDYRAARARAGPDITVRRLGSLAGGDRGPRSVRAATVAGAAAAAGLALDGHVVAALNGDQATRDGQTPLATGDTVLFLAADAGGYIGRL
jgi:molybdopterin-guanine dinucleotide biosynthesis protein A